MKQLNINPMFRDKIPPLTAEEFERLEENILSDGEVLEPLVVWNDTIVDGHNRWRVIQRHPNIPYHIKEMDFADEYEVLYWICLHQIGRRNVTDEQKTLILGEAFEARKMTQGTRNQYVQAKSEKDQSGPFQNGDTAEKVAKEFGVGRTTVKRAKQFLDGVNAADEISPGFKNDVIAGSVKAPKSVISELRNLPEKDKSKAVEAIKSGEIDEAKTIINTVKGVDAAIKPMSGKQSNNNAKMDIEEVITSLYDTSEVVHTVDDLLEQLVDISDDYIKKIRRVLQMYSTTYQDKSDRKKVFDELDRANKALNNVKELVK